MSSIHPIDFNILFDFYVPIELRIKIFSIKNTFDRPHLFMYYQNINKNLAFMSFNPELIKMAIDDYNKLSDIDKQYVIDRWNASYTQDIIASENLDSVIIEIYYYRMFNLDHSPNISATIELINNEMKNKKYVRTIEDIMIEEKMRIDREQGSCCVII